MRSQIIGTGSYAPEKVLTNRDLEEVVATSDEWIVKRTGIRERHIAADDEATSDLACKAAVRALEMARVRPEDVELIIVATVTGDMPVPSCAAVLQSKLGNKKGFAFDVSAACSGSLYGLSIADRYVASGVVRNALVVGSETLSRVTDWTDRSTCVLFGDGAGAMVLGPTEDLGRGVIATRLHSDGSAWDILYIAAGGSKLPPTKEPIDQMRQFVKMNGREVYKIAVRAQEEASREVLAAAGLSADDVTWVVAHQANQRILETTLERLGISMSRAWLTLPKYGNTSAASLPTTLDEANRSGRLKEGDVLLAMAAGGGMTWGSALIRW